MEMTVKRFLICKKRKRWGPPPLQISKLVRRQIHLPLSQVNAWMDLLPIPRVVKHDAKLTFYERISPSWVHLPGCRFGPPVSTNWHPPWGSWDQAPFLSHSLSLLLRVFGTPSTGFSEQFCLAIVLGVGGGLFPKLNRGVRNQCCSKVLLPVDTLNFLKEWGSS